MIKVKVPATSANLGAGFDCLGLALGLYNYVWAEETDSGLCIDITDSTSVFLPKDERNLVYRSMQVLFDKVGYIPKGIHLVLENNVPVTRGLGSSSAGIVGGLVAANEISGANLPVDELLHMAAKIEGHPDNVAPALLGGLTVNVHTEESLHYVKSDLPDDLAFAVFIPDFILSTKRSRGVVPKNISVKDAVFNMGRSALLVSSIMTGKYENIRTAVDDKIHQNQRKQFIPNIDELFSVSYNSGALGIYLSGAGPSTVAIIRKDDVTTFEQNLNKFLNSKMKDTHLRILNADNAGAVVCK